MLARKRRVGVTLLEILIAFAIIATLAAVLYPTLGGQLRRGQSTALARQLDNLRTAILSFRENVLRYPHTLSELTVALASGDTDSCDAPIPTANRNAWRGPYLAQNIVGDIVVGDAEVQNLLLRNPPNTSGGQIGSLLIEVQDVTQEIATDLEAQFDGNANFGTGTILWAGGLLTFQIPIRGC